ncbi:hypothetical protein CSOJ01_13301 [Colletotrichum sojae]|uniref:Uncharacterized protein n=1 Tax=Colletotrichum sojae TaxID=2175907 RepID=A0A8H6ISV0_9PEZI|nr:hypothetical protein CSOJ01_13301 [Colletotrichum sojae]
MSPAFNCNAHWGFRDGDVGMPGFSTMAAAAGVAVSLVSDRRQDRLPQRIHQCFNGYEGHWWALACGVGTDGIDEALTELPSERLEISRGVKRELVKLRHLTYTMEHGTETKVKGWMLPQLLIRWENRLGPSSRRATCVARTTQCSHTVLTSRRLGLIIIVGVIQDMTTIYDAPMLRHRALSSSSISIECYLRHLRHCSPALMGCVSRKGNARLWKPAATRPPGAHEFRTAATSPFPRHFPLATRRHWRPQELRAAVPGID